MSRSLVVRVLVFVVLAGVMTSLASAETVLARHKACMDEAWKEYNTCLVESDWLGDFKCDRGFEINEAACDLELLAALVWPF